MGIETALIASAVGTVGAAAMDNRAQRKAVSSMEKQREQSRQYIDQAIKNARSDIFKLFPAAQESRQKGLEAGISLYPQMLNTFQQGNVAAQNALIQGLPQIQNAILGNPVNMGGLQAVSLQQPQGLPPSMTQLTPINQLGLENG